MDGSPSGGPSICLNVYLFVIRLMAVTCVRVRVNVVRVEIRFKPFSKFFLDYGSAVMALSIWGPSFCNLLHNSGDNDIPSRHIKSMLTHVNEEGQGPFLVGLS